MTRLTPSQRVEPGRQSVDAYLHAATRANTRRAYQSAVEHYESVWGGYLPATAEQVAEYLAHFAGELSGSTLKQRLSALATWHKEQGFADPTKAPIVRKTMKGIRELHPSAPKQAAPVAIDTVSQVVHWLETSLKKAIEVNDAPRILTLTRNRAMLLLGFWRGFRSDELCRLSIEHIQAERDQGITLFLPRSKSDRSSLGKTFHTPALNELCPVSAYLDWLLASGLKNGPVFRGVNRWGKISDKAMHPASLITLLRSLLEHAGIQNANAFSSHSLRRGFANWANDNQWDVKTLMQYVGWRDMQSAVRYLDAEVDPFAGSRKASVKISSGSQSLKSHQPFFSATSPTAVLEATLSIQRYHDGVRTMKKTRLAIERFCLTRFAAKMLSSQPYCYEISVPYQSSDDLNERLDALIQEAHNLGQDNQCMVDLQIKDPTSGQCWD